jgi:hypothetical protein
VYGGYEDQQIHIRHAVEDNVHIVVYGTDDVDACLATGTVPDIHGVGFEDLCEDTTGFEKTGETPAYRMGNPGLIAATTDKHNLVHGNPHYFTGLNYGI